MALLPPSFLDTVLALGIGDDPNTRQWIGTGFLLGSYDKMIEGQKAYTVFLVTNRHVLEGKRQMWARVNTKAGAGSTDFRLALFANNGRPNWITHPSADIDLAALFVNARELQRKDMQFAYFPVDEQALSLRDMHSKGLSEGDGIFVLGYPMGLVGDLRQFVIARKGSIARIRDAIAGYETDFLIDCPVFPGNSGGPVINEPTGIAIEGTSAVTSAYLIGVAKAYIPYQDIAYSPQTKRPRILFEENSGLSPVIPCDYLVELMELARKRMKSRLYQARWRQRQKTEPDA